MWTWWSCSTTWGDYSQRPLLRRRAKEAAESAIGRRVDVRVTDRPEWSARTKCLSSFERHVASRAITLRERPVSDVDLHKEIPIPPTDEAMSQASLSDLAQALEDLTHCLAPYEQEVEAMASGDSKREALSRARRMRRVCASAQAAMETGLEALNHALPGPHPPRTRDLGALIDRLPVVPPERDRLATAVEGLDLAAAAQWREMGTYQTPALYQAISAGVPLQWRAEPLTTVFLDSNTKPVEAHPRMGGEHGDTACGSVVGEGSPPHGRGAHTGDLGDQVEPGLTPAWAGSTPRKSNHIPHPLWLTPAWAGSTSPMTSSAAPPRAHPRMGGEHSP